MNNFETFISNLRQKLKSQSLPGTQSQETMSPITRKLQGYRQRVNDSQSNNARKSAVLVLIYPVANEPYIVFMKRSRDNTVHSQQVSFPGGKVEKGDTSLIHTALREANEEVGVDPKDVQIIGQLSTLYIPPSNFDVYPVVGYLDYKPNFITNDEVDKLLEVKLSDLLDKKNHASSAKATVGHGYQKIKHRDGNEYVVPCYDVNDEVIWGATAMMLAEFLSLTHLVIPKEAKQ